VSAAVLAVAACGAGTPASHAPVAVTIDSNRFDPRELSIERGTTVTWTNEDDVDHNVHWFDGSGASPQMGTGASYERTFDTAGEYGYLCDLHPLMMGVVMVTG
jgi:plastocyanin